MHEFRREREENGEEDVPPRSKIIGDTCRRRSMMRVRFKIFRRLVSPTVIFVVIRQNVFYNVEEVLEGAHLRAAWNRLYDQLFRNTSP